MPDGETSFFWCSEKSKLLGDELRRKMKDLLKKKPPLAELTGISESRLDCFAIHLRAYLIGSAVTNAQASSMLSTTLSKDGSASASEHGLNAQLSVVSLKPMQSQQLNGKGSRTIPLHLSSLTSRSSSLSESLLRNSPSVGVSKDRLRLHGDSYLSCTDGQTAGTASSTEVPSSTCVEDDKLLTETSPSNILEPLFPTPSFLGSAAAIPPLVSSVFSPYYCWCPPSVSTLQYTVGTPHLPFLSADSLSLPQLSSILPAHSSSISTSRPPLVTDASALNFPPLLPEPLIRLPSSLPALQQIPTFTPLVCDPIVHIPVMDVYSSGQGYLVSAGPAIPPLHSNIVNPLIPETESMVERSARETLRLLLNSSNQPNPQLINVLPSVLSRSEGVQNMLAAGRRGIYSGTIDLDAIANGFATRGLVSLSGGPVDRVNEMQVIKENVDMEKPESSGECLFYKDFIDYEQGGEN